MRNCAEEHVNYMTYTKHDGKELCQNKVTILCVHFTKTGNEKMLWRNISNNIYSSYM